MTTPEHGRPDDRTVVVPTGSVQPPPYGQHPPTAQYPAPAQPYNPYGNDYPDYPAVDQYPDGYPQPQARRTGGMVVALLLHILAALPFLGGAVLVVVAGASIQSMVPAEQLADFRQLTGVDPFALLYGLAIFVGAVAFVFVLLAFVTFAGRNWARILGTLMTVVFVLITGFAVFAGLAGGVAVDPSLTGGGQLVAGLAVVAAPALFALIGTILDFTPGANRFFAARRR
ncbi:hypothetical protein [Pseudonocardia sp.]|uniref:hypothetical protein n=1 Tax=Pseudonocardia sp. TaxID=60912 RepID=UPI003D0E7CFC